MAAAAASPSAVTYGVDHGFNEDLFELFVRMRCGEPGQPPVFWYAVGDVCRLPDGATLAKLEGVDAARCVRVARHHYRQLSRRIFVFRDARTNKILREVGGAPVRPLRSPAQVIDYRLQGAKLVTQVVQQKPMRGDGGVQSRVTTSSESVFARQLSVTPAAAQAQQPPPRIVSFQSPLFTDVALDNGVTLQAYENYDFFAVHAPPPASSWSFMCNWSRQGSAPPLAGNAVMKLVMSRATSLAAALPPSAACLRGRQRDDGDAAGVDMDLRTYIERHEPMYARPPADMDEVERLRREQGLL